MWSEYTPDDEPSMRYPLPCCMYKAIRTAFPSENGQYHAFEDDES